MKQHNNNRDVYEKLKLQEKIDSGITFIKDRIKIITTELIAQNKNKKKYQNIQYKEEALKLINERFDLLKVFIINFY
jgi:hypothetical protein